MSEASSKLYVLRATTFGYDDEYYHVHSPGGGPISGVFSDRESALQEWQKLEAAMLERRQLDCEPRFFELSDEKNRELDALIFARTGRHIITEGKTPSARTWIYQDSLADLAAEDLFVLLQAAGALAYVMTEFDAQSKFYVRWLKLEGRYHSFDADRWGYGVGRTLCYSTDPDKLAEQFVDPEDYEDTAIELRGSYADLSSTPELLKSLVSSSPLLSYEEASQTLSIQRQDGPTIREVNALLKQPLFEIREVSHAELMELQASVLQDVYDEHELP